MSSLEYSIAINRRWKILEFDIDTNTVDYTCRCGNRYTKRVKHFAHQECNTCYKYGIVYGNSDVMECPLCTGPCPMCRAPCF